MSLPWKLCGLINFPGKLRFHANCSLGTFNEMREDGYYTNKFPPAHVYSARMLDKRIKRSLLTTHTQRQRDQHPQNCHCNLCCSVITLWEWVKTLFWHKTTAFWVFHFTNIFTGVTGCDRAGRNRQLCHLKTTTPQGHTRRLNISPHRKQNKKETVESDRLSCGLINEHRTQSQQIRGQWKLFDWMLCRLYHMATTVQMASHITHRCHIVHPVTPLHIPMFTLCLLFYLATYLDYLETVFYTSITLFQ